MTIRSIHADDAGGGYTCFPPPLVYLRLFARLALLRLYGAVPMNEDSALIRQWRLLKLLSSRHYGATVKELSDEMKVNEKTIRRDLQTFEQVGFPLEETVGERGRKNWKVRGTKDQPELNFALDEALALYMGRRFLEPLAGTFFLGRCSKRVQEDSGLSGQDGAGVLGENRRAAAPPGRRRRRLLEESRFDRRLDAGD